MTIWTMSLTAAALILVIALIRALTVNKLPKRTFLLLWGVALCRLLIPFSIPSPFSAYNAVRYVPQASDSPDILAAVLRSAARMKPLPASDGAQASHLPGGLSPWTLLWIGGAILLAAWFLTAHLRCRRDYRAALPVPDPFPEAWLRDHPTKRPVLIRQSDRIAAPMTYGILHPVILLPKTTDYADWDRLNYILTHELIHIRRFDALKKWLLAAALCAHWFNPLVWAMYLLAGRDIELSCDEAVVRAFGMRTRSAYALTLIGMEETKGGSAPLGASFSRNAAEERITAIMSVKRTTRRTLLLALALVLCITAAFATSAMGAGLAARALRGKGDLAAAAGRKSVGAFQEVFGRAASRYASNINQFHVNSAATADGCTLFVDSTLFTDANAYAIVGLRGAMTEDFDLGGRILAPDGRTELYGLNGDETDELTVGADGTRYFLFAGTISQSADVREDALPFFAGAPYQSLRDCPGATLELTAFAGTDVRTLRTPVESVYSDVLVLRPGAPLTDGGTVDQVLLTPYEIAVAGHDDTRDESNPIWPIPKIQVSVMLAGGETVDLSPMSGGGEPETGEFDLFNRFRDGTLDLGRVRAVVIDGTAYPVNR